MKTTLITTLKHNIGDDFVREGLLYLLKKIHPNQQFEFIHKHAPVTAIFGLEKLKYPYISKLIEPITRKMNISNRIDTADLLVQCGAPIYWCHPDGPHCADNEWFGPLVEQKFAINRRNRKFINIAGGSCQRYHLNDSELIICPKCNTYISKLFDVCDLTLLRDNIAKRMLNIAGRDAEVLPCTSIFARDNFCLKPRHDNYIVVNFMEYGGHYTFGQNIDAESWRKNFIALVNELSKCGRVIAACHDQKEAYLAARLVPNIEHYIIPANHLAYMQFYSGARFGIVNRVHAGFIMASFGKPVLVIGNDSRAKMIELLNLNSHFVNDFSRDFFEESIQNLVSRETKYLDEIESIREISKTVYLERLQNALTDFNSI